MSKHKHEELFAKYNEVHLQAQKLTFLSKKPDIKKALPIYEDLVLNSYPPACFDLGYMYLLGYLVEKDLKSANFYFELGYDLDHYFSAVQLSINTRTGRGCEKDLFKTEYVVNVCGRLHGLSYTNPIYKTVANVLLKAIEYDDLDAINTYAYIHEYGIGVKEDYDIAIKYYSLGLEKGYEFSMINLANCYEHGKGVKRNLQKAKDLFEMAAEKNNVYAINRLASSYYKDENDKMKMLMKGSELKSTSSMISLAKIYYKKGEYSSSIEYLLKASELTLIPINLFPKFNDDEELFLNIVKFDGKSLNYASDRVKNLKRVVIQAILQDNSSLRFASKELQNSIEIYVILDKKYINLLPNNDRVGKLKDLSFFFK